MNLRMNIIISLTFVLLGFMVFIMLFEAHDQARRQDEFSDHAEVIKKSLWDYYPTGSAKYLQLAADLKKYEQLLVKDFEGEVFLSVQGKQPERFDRFLLLIGLLHTEDQTIDIFEKDKSIGTLHVRFRHDTVYTYFYVLAILVPLFAVYVLFLITVQSKKYFEIRVTERTKELLETVKLLEKEIAERKRAEKSLRKSEKRLRQVVENMPVMMDALDENSNVIVWNREAERVTGYSNDPIMANYQDFGFCGVVPKPYTKHQIAEVLNKVFGEKG